MTTDYPNGHKDWLEAHAGDQPTVQNAVAHAALYLGRILERNAYCTSCLAALAIQGKNLPKWFTDACQPPAGSPLQTE
jgi:hypothetical protein